jgi:phenylpropionate dioxygenase-like ring-hydroxylating dioxygenase large terminal subunit
MADQPSLNVPHYRDSASPTYQEVIACDAIPPLPIFLERAESDVDVGSAARTAYTDPAFAACERAAMWSRVWYVAGRVEQVPEPGDFIVYEGPLASLIIMRGHDGALRAFLNSCPHRGMTLCEGEGAVSRITCPFHSFAWDLQGKIAHIPSRWDFPELKERDISLSQIKLDSWGGFIFVNHDPDAAPLTTYLGRIVTDFAAWRHEDRYAAKILRKTIHANWKTCIETFIESFHLSGIHPQALPFGGDTSSQYDVWPDQPHMSRMLQPLGVRSDQYGRDISEQQILAAALRTIMGQDAVVPPLADGQTARASLAQIIRQNPATPAISDTELLDAMQYSIFPNIVLFRSAFYPYTYRFTPDRVDPNKAVYDFYMFEPLPADGSAPPAPEIIELGDDDNYTNSGAFPPWLGQIYDQDSAGLKRIQNGLQWGGNGDLFFASYQEVRIRQLHQILERYLQKGPLQL